MRWPQAVTSKPGQSREWETSSRNEVSLRLLLPSELTLSQDQIPTW